MTISPLDEQIQSACEHRDLFRGK